MTNQEATDLAVNVVLGFVAEMNNWETRMHYRSRIESGKSVSADWQLLGTIPYDEVQNEYFNTSLCFPAIVRHGIANTEVTH